MFKLKGWKFSVHNVTHSEWSPIIHAAIKVLLSNHFFPEIGSIAVIERVITLICRIRSYSLCIRFLGTLRFSLGKYGYYVGSLGEASV